MSEVKSAHTRSTSWNLWKTRRSASASSAFMRWNVSISCGHALRASRQRVTRAAQRTARAWTGLPDDIGGAVEAGYEPPGKPPGYDPPGRPGPPPPNGGA